MRRKFYTILKGNTKSLTVVQDNTRIVPLQPKGQEPIFFIVDSYPYFIDVVQQMGTDHPVLSLIGQKDTQTTEAEYSIIDEAAAHVKTILGHQPHGPYALGGCSASGVVAFEVAQQLQRLGHEVGLLVLFDTPNPYFMGEYSAWRRSFASHRADLSRMSWNEVPHWLATKTRARFGKIVDSLKLAWPLKGKAGPSVEQFGPLEIRISAARKYRPAPYSGPILVVKRRPEELNGRYLDPQYGWGGVTRGNIEVCVVVGADHLDIFKDDSDRELVAQTLNRHLDWLAARVGKVTRHGSGAIDSPSPSSRVTASPGRNL